MKIFKTGYNDAYFDTVIERFFRRMGIVQKSRLIRSFKSSGNLLEIGCGEGLLLNGLKKYYNVAGMDISESAVRKARSLIGVPLVVADIEKDDIKNKYDIILAFDVLEHLKNPDRTIIKIERALKRNGVFIFSVPNNFGLFGRLMTKMFNFIDKTHISTFERKKWVKLVNDVGFKPEILNQTPFGLLKADFAKHFSFNLVIIAQKAG